MLHMCYNFFFKFRKRGHYIFASLLLLYYKINHEYKEQDKQKQYIIIIDIRKEIVFDVFLFKFQKKLKMSK